MLHLINQSPLQHGTLDSCLRFIEPEDSILLIEDGVYGASPHTPCREALELASRSIKLYALEADLSARGLNKPLLPCITLVSYAEFVELSASHDTVQSWL
ncbi:MAG: sulfurtransferase complex subunit TusB [Gammaproteobacteria bacterium]|nr:MAG: sulfurtransferase complex subunit TusB [Gammaproteobacteria bacterium]